jgi:NTP pyrophosphatase (non-canonical NTP hydrolase)
MVMEESGEMLNALGKANRGRVTKEDVITELVDVSIMMEQMAVHFGYDEFKTEKERKLKRLKERLEKHKKKEK